MNTIFDLQRYAARELKDAYDEDEVRALCSLSFQHILQCTNVEIHLKKHEQLEERFVDKFLNVLKRLKDSEPIQYILGETLFSDCRFRLNRATLIPRPETEELVRWIVESGLRAGQSVLDIGTGSGCIAVSLGCLVPGVRITGVDISPEAVEQASENARLNGVEGQFLVRDILQAEQVEWASYDVIVSNPPYVRESEREWMQERVLRYEPERALFVSDEDPLLFYRLIARFAQKYLSPAGSLFFEINEAFGSEMLSLLSSLNFQNIRLKHDFFGKPRFIHGIKG